MKVICENCGATNPALSTFCANCDGFLGWAHGQGRGAVPSRPTPEPERGPGGSVTPIPTTDRAPVRGWVSADPTTVPLPTLDGQRQTPARTEDPEPEVAPRTPGQEAQRHTGAVAPEPDPRPVLPGAPRCPNCANPLDPSWRFCHRCGRVLSAPAAAKALEAIPTEPATRSWWRRWVDSDERATRRAYRRSLPPLYRWRRVVLTLVAVVVAGLVLSMVGRNPMAFAVSIWHELRDDVVEVSARATTLPTSADPKGALAANAVDHNRSTAWTVPWQQPPAGAACGRITNSATLRLEFPSTRVRKIAIISGVSDPSIRALQLLPKTVFVSTAAGPCLSVALTRVDSPQVLDLDSVDPTTTLTVQVVETFPATDPRVQRVVSLTEVVVLARP